MFASLVIPCDDGIGRFEEPKLSQQSLLGILTFGLDEVEASGIGTLAICSSHSRSGH